MDPHNHGTCRGEGMKLTETTMIQHSQVCENDGFCSKDSPTKRNQGWAYSLNDETGVIEIQRCDTCDIFADDTEAVKFASRLGFSATIANWPISTSN